MGGFLPGFLQIQQRLVEHGAGAFFNHQAVFAVFVFAHFRRKHGVADFQAACVVGLGYLKTADIGNHAVELEEGVDFGLVFFAYLQHRAQLFVKQAAEHGFFVRPFGDQRVDLHKAGHVHIQPHPRRKRHFRERGEQTAVAAVVVGQEFVFGHQLLHHFIKRFQTAYIIDVGRFAAGFVVHLRQRGAAHACFSKAQIDKQQYAVGDVFQLGGNGFAHILHGREAGNHQRQRRGNGFLFAAVRPHGFHRQRVFAHGNADAQVLAGFGYGLHGAVEFFVFTRVAAGGHPVGGEFDVADVADVHGGEVGDGFADAHSARRGRVKQGDGGFFAHRHRFAAIGVEAHHGYGAVGHRRLVAADHLVAGGQAADAAVANGNQEVFGSHGRQAQYAVSGFFQVDLAA